jgi:hypothetical protein
MTNTPDDDQQWLDLMAGREAPGADARTRREAAWLRAAMLSYRVSAPPGAPADAEDRIGRLLTRARNAGVLPPAANDAGLEAAGSTRVRRPRWPHALAASIAVCGAMLVFLQQNPGSDTDGVTLRGAPVQRVQTPDAASRRQQMLQTLRAAGFDAQPFERLGRPGIDVALALPLPPAQAEVLKGLGLTPPAGPSLQIEFVTPAQPAP